MGIKILDKIRIPIIDVELPTIELPELPTEIPKLDNRQLEILRYALMDDLADKIPIIGDIAADTAYAEIKRLMTPDEYEQFVRDNKWLPSSLAALKVFIDKYGNK